MENGGTFCGASGSAVFRSFQDCLSARIGVTEKRRIQLVTSEASGTTEKISFASSVAKFSMRRSVNRRRVVSLHQSSKHTTISLSELASA